MLYLEEARDGSIKINLTRGDDAVIEVPLQNIDEEEYILGEDEYLIFDVRAVPREDSELLIHITSVPGSSRIVFTHEDTVNLEPGQYSAEIQMMTSDGKRITIWPKPTGKFKIKDTANRKNFILMPEVVYE
jgi:hypothetical protein